MLIKNIEYKINRQTAVVSEFDKIYCELLEDILKKGEVFKNRTGINTLSVEGVSFKLDVNKWFPILETKKVVVKNALSEMLWIYQAQSNNIEWLNERGNNIWNEWKIDSDGIYRTYDNEVYDADFEVDVIDINGNVLNKKAKSMINGKNIKSAKYFGLEYAGTIGTAYGWINNKFKRPNYVLEQLKTNPHDRRMIISLWQDEYIKSAVLPSCVWSSEWKVCNGKLNAYVHQRSADVPLGLPFNVTQYAILLAMFAKVSNLEVGNLNWSIMDAHIYVNQIEGIKTQINRYKKMLCLEKFISSASDREIEAKYKMFKSERIAALKMMTESSNPHKIKPLIENIEESINLFELMITKEKPILELANKENFFDFNNKIDDQHSITGNSDIKVLKYTSSPFIKMPISQ